MKRHQSVLLEESITGLNIVANGIYVDATFGRGGHSKVILDRLNSSGRLIALDKDMDAIQHAKEYFSSDERFTIVQGSFARLRELIMPLGVWGRINGILLDLGVSSPQLDTPERGFSFMQAGPLDMRMDQTQSFNATEFVNEAETDELIRIFKEYGEERFARRIAAAIVCARLESPITTTNHLAEIVKRAHPKWEKHKHPATRVFQALRIHINHELEDLSNFFQQCVDSLSVGGRLAVISFHSLEDRMVKQFLRKQEQGVVVPKEVPVMASQLNIHFKRIGKAIKPSAEEITRNIRARSAVLRIGEKVA